MQWQDSLRYTYNGGQGSHINAPQSLTQYHIQGTVTAEQEFAITRMTL